MKVLAAFACLFLTLATSALAQAGNEQALQVAKASAEASIALKTLTQSAQAIRDPALRQAALAALDDTACIHHRAGLTPRDKNAHN